MENNSIHSSSKKTNTFSSTNKSQTSNSNSLYKTEGVSFGERLYRKSIALKEEKEAKSKNVKMKEEADFKKRCSFKPKLNRESCSIYLKTNYETYANTPNRISALITDENCKTITNDFNSQSPEVKKKKKIIESHKKKKEEEDLKELRPSIKKSQKEIDEITTKLYREAEIKKVLQEQDRNQYFSEICTFTPKISNSSQPKLENFFQRLQLWIERRNENYFNELQNSLKDSKTGQFLFQPSVKRTVSSIEPDMSNKGSIFIDLYEETKRIDLNKKEKQQKYEEELNQLASSKKATQQIEEIHNKNKEECFNTLFQLLDFNQEGMLRYSEDFQRNIQTFLHPVIRHIIDPLINELSIHQEELNYEEFILAINQLYQVVSVDEKRKLVNWYVDNIKRQNSPRKKRASFNKSCDFAFKPVISESSEQIFQKSGKIVKNFAQRNLEFIKKKENFINEKKIEKIENEFKECTFRPKLIKRSELY